MMLKIIIFVITVLAVTKSEANIIIVSIKDCIYVIPKSYKYITQTDDGLYLQKGSKYYLLKGYWGVFAEKSAINKEYICKTTNRVLHNVLKSLKD